MAGRSPVQQVDAVTPGGVAVWDSDGVLRNGPPVRVVSQNSFHIELASPAPTTSTIYRMMGLALTFTPLDNSRGIFTVDGVMGNTNNGVETDISLFWGTGTPPVNGAVRTGTQLGQPIKFVTGRAGEYVPFSQTGLLQGLIAGTAYWVDLAVQVSAGTSIVTNVQVTGFTLIDLPSS